METSQLDPARLPELYAALDQLLAAPDLNEVLERTLQAALKLTHAEQVIIQFSDHSLFVLPKPTTEREQLIGTALAELMSDVARDRQDIVIADTQNDPRFATEPLAALFPSRTVLSVPLQAWHEFLGVLLVDRAASTGSFTPVDRTTLAFFAR